MSEVSTRILGCVKRAMPKALKTCLWLMKIILPISLAVRLLQYSGWLGEASVVLQPMFSYIGLPAETAIVFFTSIFTPLYTAIAIITSMTLTVREVTILALMCLISHNIVVETSIQAHTGSSWWKMVVLRISMSIIVAFVLNLVLPHSDSMSQIIGSAATVESCNSIAEVLKLWLLSSLSVTGMIIVIVTLLMILHYLLDEFKLTGKIAKALSPLMRVFGLSDNCSLLWLVGNLVGLAYGGAIMLEQMDEGKLSQEEGDLLNHHLAISHSILEDNLIFVAIGVPLLWILATRLIFAMAVVWIKKGFMQIRLVKNG